MDSIFPLLLFPQGLEVHLCNITYTEYYACFMLTAETCKRTYLKPIDDLELDIAQLFLLLILLRIFF